MIHAKRILSLLLGILLVSSIHAAGQKDRNQPVANGIVWQTRFETALQSAKTSGKPVLVDFMAEWCPWCKMLEDSTFPDPGVMKKMRAFIAVKIDVDKQKAVADQFGANARKNGGMGIPNILFLSSGGKKVKHIVGYRDVKTFTATLDTVLSALDN